MMARKSFRGLVALFAIWDETCFMTVEAKSRTEIEGNEKKLILLAADYADKRGSGKQNP
jgi:hypothetical protein